jgi:ADP-ribose pyrophosphatase YjhB (NUDIX family)
MSDVAAVAAAPSIGEARSYPARPFLAVSVAVVREDRVLVAERLKPPGAGVFTLPGGMVETGETLAEAGLRELMEEVGVSAEMIGFLRPVEITERDGEGRVRFHAVVLPHAARWTGGEPRSSEEAGRVLFATPAEIARLPTTKGLLAIVEQALRLAREAG